MYNEMMDTIGLVNTVDPELAAAMDRELNRQRQNIELIASENIVSPAVMAAMGSILTNNPILAKRINSAVFPGTQVGPLEHVIAAKAVCFCEALKPEFKEYARKIVENAQALAAELQARGVKLVSGGTDNHLMLIDLRDEECTGKELEARLDSVHITANKNTVPGETRSPFVTSGVRLGTPAVTTRGMGVAEMKVIADCIADCIWHYDEKKDEISDRVLKLTRDFPLYQ